MAASTLGLPTLPSQYVLPLSRPVYTTVFTFQNLTTAWQAKLLFWLVIFGTLATVPLLAPRALILVFPWAVLSLFATPGYYRMGDQYRLRHRGVDLHRFHVRNRPVEEMVRDRTIGPRKGGKFESLSRSIASANSKTPRRPAEARVCARLPSRRRDRRKYAPTGRFVRDHCTAGQEPGDKHRTWHYGGDAAARSREWASPSSWSGVLMFNTFLNPLNPLAAPLKNDRPFVPQASLGLTGGIDATDYNRVLKVVSMMPNDAIVGASPMLFTFVSGDPNAFPLQAGIDYSNFPFHEHEPQYFFLLGRGGTTFPSKTLFKSELYDRNTTYGVRALIPSTYVGGVLLFQKGYHGSTEILGTPPVFNGGTYTAGAGLNPGRAGTFASNITSRSGTVIETSEVTGPDSTSIKATGHLFSGPGVTLPGGSYNVTVVLSGTQTGNITGIDQDPPVMTISVGGFQVTFDSFAPALTTFSGGGWLFFTFHVSFAYPVLGFIVTVNNRHDWYRSQVDYVSIAPVSGS